MGTMNQADKDFLVKTLVDQAMTSGDPPEYFKDLAKRAELPERWYPSYYGQLRPNPAFTARNIVDWAGARDINPDKPTLTTLGSLLRPLFQDIGGETAQRVVVIIVSNRLIPGKDQLTKLMMDYGIPFPAEGTTGDVADISVPLGPKTESTAVGPEMNWRGPEDVKLQGFLWSQPDYMDGRFLMRATDRALSVCHVSIPDRKRSGTGFLIEKKSLLITNYHVLEDPDTPGDDKNQNAAGAILKFKYLSSTEGDEEKALEFRLADNPIIASSPVPELDFVLLRVEDGITTAADAKDIKPLKYKDSGLPADKSLNIIQHPEGGPLMFAFSSNGVTGVYDDGRIQYVSKAAGGSSGSPCFNDKWELVALHHAERSTMWGVRREGLLFDHVFRKIKDNLA